ncbi:MAG: dihydropteroate synthase [Bacteroidota bacterium]|nr:dihydropteroate synthase [Bacteroidota bacterium]
MSAQDTEFSQKTERIFKPEKGALLMGILNITPDSFFDGGNYLSEKEWLVQAEKMILEGADIIDVGASSTRPGTKGIPVELELQRAIPVIKSLRKNSPEILLSIDTYRSEVAKQAVEAGADIINDISGGSMDDKMFKVVSELNVPYILMHIQGVPKNMQVAPFYENVVSEVDSYFEKRIEQLKELGFRKIILDPGFGFGKSLEHNYDLLKNLKSFGKFGLPVLAGVSRKSMICKLLNLNPKDSLNGTTVANTMAILNGAKILRVHDVKEAKEAIRMCEF